MLMMLIMVEKVEDLFVATLSYLTAFLVFSSSLQNLKLQKRLLGFDFFAGIGFTKLQ